MRARLDGAVIGVSVISRRVRGLLRSSRRTRSRARATTAYVPAGADTTGRSILFLRSITSFTGGHLKTHDYFEHVAASTRFTPFVWFAPGTVWDSRNPWTSDPFDEVALPERPDALFVGGMTWRLIPKRYDRPDVPVINLVQHLRHADPNDPRSAFLSRRAIRICVSPEVAAAVQATRRANGPVITIPNGIAVDAVRRRATARTVDLVVLANKQPELGRRLARRLTAGEVDLIDTTIPRDELLDRIGRARVALLLPNPAEGFYLPALEAMALGTIVVCPDCIGNRSFCLHGETAFRPAYEDDEIIAQTKRALDLPSAEAEELARAAMRTAEAHDISIERSRFGDVLARIDHLWTS